MPECGHFFSAARFSYSGVLFRVAARVIFPMPEMEWQLVQAATASASEKLDVQLSASGFKKEHLSALDSYVSALQGMVAPRDGSSSGEEEESDSDSEPEGCDSSDEAGSSGGEGDESEEGEGEQSEEKEGQKSEDAQLDGEVSRAGEFESVAKMNGVDAASAQMGPDMGASTGAGPEAGPRANRG